MKRTVSGILLAAIAGAFGSQPASAGETYITFGVGFAAGEVHASTTAVNHPTRCDSLLYSNPADAPADAACTDNTPRRFFGDDFDLGGAFSGSVSLGYAWERIRVEAELSASSHDGESRPAIAGADNPALQGKASEWSADSPPYYRISNFKARQLFVNVYYSFGGSSAWTPFVGLGAGFARIETGYLASYLRSTVADGYIAAVGGDPAQPKDWQLAAAGSLSLLDTKVSDNAFGYQLAAGLERRLTDSTSAFLKLRWADFGDMSGSDIWTTIRSHAPVQSDGVTPFTSVQTLDDLGGLTATVGIRYGF